MKLLVISVSGLKFAVAVVVFLLTIEVCARIDNAIRYGAPLWGEYTANSLKSSDTEGISYNVPNARFEKWQNNGHGFRGPEIATVKSPGTVRVVCLGASESYGLYESPGMEWPAQLRTLLPSPKYQVINVSVVGLGLSSYEAYLKKYVLRLEPDIVVCFVNPLFYATGFEKKQGSPIPTSKAEARTTTKKPISHPNNITAQIRSLPKLKQVLKQALQNSFPKVLKRYQVWNLQKQINEAELKNLRGLKPKDAVSPASATSFSNDLSRLVSFLQSRHINVLLSTYPALISRDNLSTYPDIFMDNRRFFIGFSFLGMIDVLEKYNFAIRAVATTQGIMFADCQSAIPKTDHYFGDNVHYTDQGASTVAKVIAEVILGDGETRHK